MCFRLGVRCVVGGYCGLDQSEQVDASAACAVAFRCNIIIVYLNIYLFIFKYNILLNFSYFFVIAMQLFSLCLSALTRHTRMVRCKECVFAWVYVVLLVATAGLIKVNKLTPPQLGQ